MEVQKNTYCRLCAELTPPDKLFDLNSDSKRSREVVEKLAQLKHGFIHMFRDNLMPTTVCFLCLDSLYRAVTFVEKVEASQNVLKSLLNIKKEPSEISHDDDDRTDSDSEDSSSEDEKPKVKKEKEVECRVTCKHEKNKVVRRSRDSDDDSDTDSRLTWKDYNWMCAFCQTVFNSVEDLRSHSMKYHNNCTAFKCVDCNIRKLRLDTFVAHVMRHKKYLKRSCYVCAARYLRRSDAEKHRRLHLKFKHICVGCNSSFKYIKDLIEHKNKFYTDKRASRIPGKVTDNDLTCKICDKKFKTRSILQGHILIHTNRRRDHTCDVCGKCFYNKDTLMSHMVVHDESRPYQCEICKFSFKTIGQLRMHVGTHDTNRPFACEQCGKRFRLRKNLSSHMVIHSDTMPFTCEYCNKGFRFKTILNQHIRQHTGVKPYSCNLCQRAFTNWSNYNKHMKRRHGMEMAKKKHTPEGVFPINPVTGEVVIAPRPENAEEWKKQVLQRRVCRRAESQKSDSSSNEHNVHQASNQHSNQPTNQLLNQPNHQLPIQPSNLHINNPVNLQHVNQANQHGNQQVIQPAHQVLPQSNLMVGQNPLPIMNQNLSNIQNQSMMLNSMRSIQFAQNLLRN